MDWRDRFRAPAVLGARRALAEPDRAVLLCDRDGTIEAFAWEVATGSIRPVTDQGTATLVAGISHDGRQILFLRDETGAEHGHINAVPFGGGEPVDLTPDMPPYAVSVLETTEDGFVAIGMIDGASHLIVRETEGVRTVRLPGLGLGLVPSRSLLAVTEATPGRGLVMRVRLLDRETFATIEEIEEAAALASADDRFALSVPVDGWLRPAVWDRDRGVELVVVDLEGDVSAVDLSPDGSTMLIRQSHRTVDHLHRLDFASGELTTLALPTGVILEYLSEPALSGDGATAVWSSVTRPPTVVEVSATSHRPLLPQLTGEYPGAAWREFVFESTHQATIQGWMLTPPGDGPHPLILNGHGGPTAVQGPAFAPMAQAWVDNGYAFATVNYRGSTGFGEDFREALTGAIGTLEIDDIVAARHWLVENQVADPRRILLSGYSYGGYLTCMAMGVHPDLWAGGAAGAPVVDWVMLHEDSSATRPYAEALFGGGPDSVGDRMRAASPSTYAGRVTAPLFISAPTDDARTPIRPVREYVQMLLDAGGDVELHELRGGHAGAGKEQMIEMVERWIAFAGRVMSGR